MGYRTKLGSVAKCVRDKFLNKSYEEVCELVDPESPYRPEFLTNITCLGKEYFRPKDLTEFYSFDCYKACESEFMILSKSGMLELIMEYHRRVADMYKELLTGTPEDVQNFINAKCRTWSDNYTKYGMLPYYLDEPKDERDGFIARA